MLYGHTWGESSSDGRDIENPDTFLGYKTKDEYGELINIRRKYNSDNRNLILGLYEVQYDFGKEYADQSVDIYYSIYAQLESECGEVTEFNDRSDELTKNYEGFGDTRVIYYSVLFINDNIEYRLILKTIDIYRDNALYDRTLDTLWVIATYKQ